MIWLLGIGLFIVFWFIFPPFRKFSLVVGGLIVLVIVGLIVYSNYKESFSKSLIPTSQVQLIDLRLGKQYSSYQLSGEVKNISEHTLFDVYLKVKAYDCPGSEITSSCTIIGQDNNVNISVNVPPNQVRAIDSAYVSLYSMPKVRGTFLWSYEITGTRGR
jgi:hypothetical protein